MKNNRLNLNEAATMNTVNLQDIADSSTKVVQAIILLQTAALKFNNKRLMQLATKLNSDGTEFHNLVSQLIMDGGLVGDSDGNIDTDMSGQEDTRQDLSAPVKPEGTQQALESVKTKYLRRKLKEAEEAMGSDVVIDLTKPFEKVIDGLDDSEFSVFKSDVVNKLEDSIDNVAAKVGNVKGDEFTKTITAMNAAKDASDFDFALDQLYDFADKNEILVETITTKKKKRL